MIRKTEGKTRGSVPPLALVYSPALHPTPFFNFCICWILFPAALAFLSCFRKCWCIHYRRVTLRDDRGTGAVGDFCSGPLNELRPLCLALPSSPDNYTPFFFLFAPAEGVECWGNARQDPIEGLTPPVRVAGKPITGAAKLSVSARGRFWSSAVGTPEASFSRQEEERSAVSPYFQEVVFLSVISCHVMSCRHFPNKCSNIWRRRQGPNDRSWYRSSTITTAQVVRGST